MDLRLAVGPSRPLSERYIVIGPVYIPENAKQIQTKTDQ